MALRYGAEQGQERSLITVLGDWMTASLRQKLLLYRAPMGL